MRNQILFSAALLVALVLPARGQTSGQALESQGTTAAQSAASGRQESQELQQSPVPPGPESGAQTPLAKDTNLLSNPSRPGNATSNELNSASVELGSDAVQAGPVSNQVDVVSNAAPLTPTGRPDSPQVYATNSITGTNGPPVALQDRAYSLADQKILLQLRKIFPASAPSTEAWRAAVHFVSHEGIVTLVGYVPTANERKRIEDGVQQVPGVVQVIDNLQVALPPYTQTNQNQSLTIYIPAGTNQLSASATNELSASPPGANGLPAGSTNLSPTGPTNGTPRVYGRENLPPELQRRQEPPPR